MREIGPEEVQRFVSSVKLSGKTVKNLFAAMQMLWKSARVWVYVAHDAVLPKRHRVARRFFSLEEVQRDAIYGFDSAWSPNITPAALIKYCSSLSISTNSSGNEAISLCRYATISR